MDFALITYLLWNDLSHLELVLLKNGEIKAGE